MKKEPFWEGRGKAVAVPRTAPDAHVLERVKVCVSTMKRYTVTLKEES